MINVRDIFLTIQNALTGGDTGPVIVIVIIAVVLLFFLVVLILALYSRTPQGRVDALLEERAQGEDPSRWITRIVPLLVVIAAVVLFDVQAGKAEQCARCHTKVNYAETVSKTAHKDLDCLACHGATGIAAVPANVATYARWILVYTASETDPELRAGSVTNDSCLRCHRSVARETVERYGVRVRHSDFLETGALCRDCHGATAHGQAVQAPTEPAMNKCIVCHDGVKAPQDCAYCHVKEPIELAALREKLPQANEIDNRNCYACHDEKPCITCHGVRMPHPEGWASEAGRMGQSGEFHARQGFANREVCWRCHFSDNRPFQRPLSYGGFSQTPDGCTCHGSFGTMHGGAAWVREHGLQATGQKTGELADCYFCHDARYFCDMCHDPSMKERYNPRTGPDNYVRDIPRPEGYWEY